MKTELPAEIQKWIEEHPAAAIIGMVLIGVIAMGPAKKGVDVAGLKERRNGAWRGPGSFGRAPFGTQVSHRR